MFADIAGADIEWAWPILWKAFAILAGGIALVPLLIHGVRRDPKPAPDRTALSTLPKYPGERRDRSSPSTDR